jgi:hypothetical protein
MNYGKIVTAFVPFWRSRANSPTLDETKLSPAERRFVQDDVEGHHMDAVIQGTFGGDNPNRLLDFPPPR